MQADINPLQIFPTVVWTWDLPPERAQPLNAGISAFVDEIFTPRPPLQPGTSWQTRQDLHEEPAFAELVGLMRDAGKAVTEQLRVAEGELEITGCWANLAPVGGAHMPHHHVNNFMSGVYYVRCQEGADGITFHEPRPQTSIVAPVYRERNAYNALQVNVEVKQGRMILFPSWLTHSVPINRSDGERLSVSFNLMFSDFTRKISKPQWSPTAIV